jgi:hypothetical protein
LVTAAIGAGAFFIIIFGDVGYLCYNNQGAGTASSKWHKTFDLIERFKAILEGFRGKLFSGRCVSLPTASLFLCL